MVDERPGQRLGFFTSTVVLKHVIIIDYDIPIPGAARCRRRRRRCSAASEVGDVGRNTAHEDVKATFSVVGGNVGAKRVERGEAGAGLLSTSENEGGEGDVDAVRDSALAIRGGRSAVNHQGPR